MHEPDIFEDDNLDDDNSGLDWQEEQQELEDFEQVDEYFSSDED